MNVFLVAIGNRMPAWVDAGFNEYAKRLPPECALRLVEVPTPRRVKNRNVRQLMDCEAAALLRAVPRGARIVALDRSGQAWSSRRLAHRLEVWMQDGRDVALIVGGPDGLAPEFIDRSEQCWSLSPLTFAHALVRIVVAEQIYRAHSIVRGLPYHR